MNNKINSKAVFVNKIGGPEVFYYEDYDLPDLKEDEVLLRHDAIGVNFIDTYFRNGTYTYPGNPPFIVGAEASGTVLEIGAKVEELDVGDRVAYTATSGSYCTHRVMKAENLVKIPADVDSETAAAVMLKGLTVQYLVNRTFKVQDHQTVLFHAAAGGVGLLAGQWLRHIGATTIGTVSTKDKGKLAMENGYDHIINYKQEDFVEKVNEITKGKGVDVVYDSVGQDTYPDSLKCLRRLGHWVSFGQSSGLITNFDLQHLAQYGSLTATRPSLFHYIATRQELEFAANQLFGMLARGHLKVSINQKYPLNEAAEVHRMLESRKTTGSTILMP